MQAQIDRRRCSRPSTRWTCTAAQELRGRYKERFEKEHGVKLGFMSFFVKAAIEALKKYPVRQRLGGRQRHRLPRVLRHRRRGVDRRAAWSCRCVRDADGKSFADIEKEIAELRAQGAREGSLALEDLTGGTFTITNGGVFGSLHVHADRQPAAERHPRHAQDQGAAHGRRERPDRRAPDDVPGASPTITASSTAGRRCSSWSRSRTRSRIRGACCSGSETCCGALRRADETASRVPPTA